jgi:mevalonate kinase
MTEKNLKELLAQLQQALENTRRVDAETLKQVEELDQDINRLIEAGSEEEDIEGIMERAQSVEARFAVEHPVADRFLREIIDALAKVGI